VDKPVDGLAIWRFVGRGVRVGFHPGRPGTAGRRPQTPRRWYTGMAGMSRWWPRDVGGVGLTLRRILL
jgi:hypothetical protein